jgi:hypothetical protein
MAGIGSDESGSDGAYDEEHSIQIGYSSNRHRGETSL